MKLIEVGRQHVVKIRGTTQNQYQLNHTTVTLFLLTFLFLSALPPQTKLAEKTSKLTAAKYPSVHPTVVFKQHEKLHSDNEWKKHRDKELVATNKS